MSAQALPDHPNSIDPVYNIPGQEPQEGDVAPPVDGDLAAEARALCAFFRPAGTQ